MVEGGAGHRPLWEGMSASCVALGGLHSPLTLSFSICKAGILSWVGLKVSEVIHVRALSRSWQRRGSIRSCYCFLQM